MRLKPSELFVGAIIRGYRAEAASGRRVTCSAILDHVWLEAIHMPRGAQTMFEWDTRHNASMINRIKTIADCIRAGLVPGLQLVHDERGHEYVEETP